jgi:uncharacterized protein
MKKPYVVNLEQLQRVCSRNYALILRLLPVHYRTNQSWQIQLSNGLYFELVVLDIAPYTERFCLRQKNQQLPKICNMEIEFQLFHDAQMVEVVKFQQQDNVRQNLTYPNRSLHHKDEKTQVNEHLKTWLNLAIEHQTINRHRSILQNAHSG